MLTVEKEGMSLRSLGRTVETVPSHPEVIASIILALLMVGVPAGFAAPVDGAEPPHLDMAFTPDMLQANVTASMGEPVIFQGYVSGSFEPPETDADYLTVFVDSSNEMGWEVIVSPSVLVITHPGYKTEFSVHVVLPGLAEAGLQTVTVTATGINSRLNMTTSALLTIRVTPYYRIYIASPDADRPVEAEVGNMVECSVEVFNMGNTPVTVDVYINDTGHIFATPQQITYVATVNVSANGSTEVPLILHIRGDLNPWRDKFVWVTVTGYMHLDPNGRAYENPMNSGFWISFESPGTEILRAKHGVPIFLGFIAIPIATAVAVYRYRTSRRASGARTRTASADDGGPATE
jgi:hypothetical protein